MLEPRPYQREALRAVLNSWRDGVTRQLISLPTGTGKTVVFALLAEAIRKRTLVLAHREELLTQAAAKIRLVYPDADIGILKAEERGGLAAEVCVASIQTAARHVPELAARGFSLLICDEAHHAISPSYMRVFDELGFMGEDKDKLLIGVTATAYRGDKAGLGGVFQAITFERSILAMMRAGYLCDVRGLEVRTGATLARVHTRAGDFALDELAAAVDTRERNDLIAEAYLQHGEGRRGVAFCVNVSHAQNLAAALRERGVPCAAVWGDMPVDERRDVLGRFAAGDLQVLTNCAVLTEGWDCPETSLIMMARPTKSRGLYVQCVGRGLRLAPGKADCLLIDFVDAAKRHKLAGFGTLAGNSALPPAKGRTLLEVVEEAEQRRTRPRPTGAISVEVEGLDLFERSRFVWQEVAGHYKLSLGDGGALWVRAVGGGYSPLMVSPAGEAVALSADVLPLDYALGVCEDQARKMSAAWIARKDAPWRDAPATEKQLNALRRMKIQFEDGITRGEASDLMDKKLAEGATTAQIWTIKRHGWHSHPELLTKSEAGRLIGMHKERRTA